MKKEKFDSKKVEKDKLENLDTKFQQHYIKKEELMKNEKDTKIEKAGNDSAPSELKVENISVESLSVPLCHPRKHPRDIEELQNSIRRDGLQEPILACERGDNQYHVIDGCRRLAVAAEFGWKEVLCIIKKGVDEPEAAHLSYVKNNERNGFDPIETALHLKTMHEEFKYSLRDLELKGYGSPPSIANKMKLLKLPESVQKQIQDGELTAAHGLALAKLNTNDEQTRMAKQIIDLDLTAKRTEIRIGRYLNKGKHRSAKPKQAVPSQDIPGVYIKDSRDMSELPNKSIHMILSSPPYNIGMEYEKGITFDEHLEIIKDVLKECSRVLLPGGIMALNIDNINYFRGRMGKNKFTQIQLMAHIYQSYLRKYNILLTDMIIWKKATAWHKNPHLAYSEKLVHTNYRIFNNFEPVYIFRKNGERDLPSEEVILRSKLTKEEYISWIPSVWEIYPVQNMQGHPCIWPDELPHRLIKMFTYEGDTVLDPFLGSGNSVKVARELNREGIGYEREPQYKAVIMKTLGLATGEDKQQASESMVDYSKHALAGDDYDADSSSEKKPEPEFFSSFAAEEIADLLKSGSEAADEDEKEQD